MTHSYGSPSDELSSGPVVGLDLPVSPGLEQRPSDIPLSEMIRKCRELRAWFPDSIPTQEERWAAKREVEFRL